MQDYRNLKVWEEAHGLTKAIYRVTRAFPKEELYGMTSQLRRAALSIPTNLAEGTGRGSDRDFGRFVQIAMGSACEVEYLISLSEELAYLKKEESQQLNSHLSQIKKMLTGLLKKLKADGRKLAVVKEVYR